MSAGYAFSGEKARKLQGIVRQRIRDNLAELVADGLGIHMAGESLGLTKGQTARAWADIKAGLGRQAR